MDNLFMGDTASVHTPKRGCVSPVTQPEEQALTPSPSELVGIHDSLYGCGLHSNGSSYLLNQLRTYLLRVCKRDEVPHLGAADKHQSIQYEVKSGLALLRFIKLLKPNGKAFNELHSWEELLI
jgi:hypothetical protein